MKAIQKCLLIIDNPRSQSSEQLEWPSSNRLKKKKVQKLHVYKAHFGWVSKIIQHCIGFALLRSVIGPETSRYFINQSYAKLKPIAIATQPIAFSRASGAFCTCSCSAGVSRALQTMGSTWSLTSSLGVFARSMSIFLRNMITTCRGEKKRIDGLTCKKDDFLLVTSQRQR